MVGVSGNGGIPHSWMVYFMENPNYKWMRTGGNPHFKKPPNNNGEI
jgi:hypothetical protein